MTTQAGEKVELIALSILDGVLQRIVAWDERSSGARDRRAKGAAAAAVPLPPVTASLSYNPSLVANNSGLAHEPSGHARLLAGRFDAATATMQPPEIDHDYARDKPQILCRADIDLGEAESYANAVQVRVAKQQTGCRCGHHAFHNAINAARAISAPSELEALRALADTQSEPAFWSRFNTSLGSLLAEAERRGTNCWPWDLDFTDGEVDRSHMTHLLRTDESVGCLGGDQTFMVFQYAMGRPMLEAESLLACQRAADEFRATDGPAHRVVIVGALSHWLTVVLNKLPDEPLEVLLFDSNNTAVLGVEDAGLAEIAAAKAAERGWDHTSSKEEYYKSSLADMRDVVTLLARIFAGATDLRAEAVNGAVERMLEDFEMTVGGDATRDGVAEAEAEAVEVEAWHEWLRERQPPPVLRSGVLKTVERWGEAWLSDANRSALREWVEGALAFCERERNGLCAQLMDPARERAVRGLAGVADAMIGHAEA